MSDPSGTTGVLDPRVGESRNVLYKYAPVSGWSRVSFELVSGHQTTSVHGQRRSGAEQDIRQQTKTRNIGHR